MGQFSRFWRVIFAGLLLAMLALGIYALLNQPRPLTDADINATVAARQTQTAAAVPADIEATIDARLQITLTPTPPPSPTDAIGNTLGGLGGLILSIWNFFGFFGIVSQGLCCILLPGLVLIGILRDPPRPR